MTADSGERGRLRHELRTPLNHIIGYAEMLLEETGPNRAALAADLRLVLTNARQVLDVVNDTVARGSKETDAAVPPVFGSALAGPLAGIISAAQRLERSAQDLGARETLQDVARIVQAARQLAALVRPRPDVAAESNEALTGQQPSRGVLLIVDDDSGNRELLSRRLARDGHDVRTAGDGQTALKLLTNHTPPPVDLVLLDVIMPGMDGYEVLRRLKRDSTLQNIPVLMISAVDEVDSVVRCIELGAEDYLVKPFNPTLLRARVNASLEKKRLRDQDVRQTRELAEWNRTLEERVAECSAQVEHLGRLKRFFSPQLVELIIAGDADDPLKTHRREITVVFLDLRGFTAFAETAEPEDVMHLLHEYHAAMGALVLEHEGTLERFTGDGMMVFFNDPVPVPDPGERAVRMATAMRDRVADLRIAWKKRGYDLDIGIGIAQGYATIGAIGFEGRWDYGAIGTVTNLAARLCSEAKGGQILISSRIAGVVEYCTEVEEVGALSLRGLHQPVRTYSVLALKQAAAPETDVMTRHE
jgi:class 3 adenylate cyclase